MPTYEYRCTSCGEHLEVVQGFRDDPLTECALCGGQLRKVFGSIGIVFKGSGFYKTDSRSSGKPAASSSKSDTAKSETTTTPSSDSSSPTSTDSSSSKPSEKSSSTVAAAS